MKASIHPARSEQRLAALDLVFLSGGAERARSVDFFDTLIEQNELDPGGLLVCADGASIYGALLCQVLPGRMGAVWPPRSRPRSPELEQSLLRAAFDWLTAHDVRLVQALLRGQDFEGQQALEAGGFQRLADLLYLVWLVGNEVYTSPTLDTSSRDDADEPLQYVAYSPAVHDRFAAVMEASYEDSLDCPALNGRRNMDDVLAGYRATGVFAAERWLLVQHGARDVGCLLLTDHPHTEQWELMYMGLIPAARGHGWGRRIMQHAQRLTAAARRHALSLAVDMNNLPALRVYRQNGFCMLDQRRAMLYEMTGQRHSSDSLGH